MNARAQATRADSSSREFTSEELSDIIRRAAQNAQHAPEGRISYEEMISIGEELGIDKEQLEMAADDVAAGRRNMKRRIRNKLAFFHHLAVYAIVNTGLVLLNVLTGGGLWALFPIIGWGIGLAIHGAKVYLAEKSYMMGIEPPADARESQREADRESRREYRQRQRERRERFAEGISELVSNSVGGSRRRHREHGHRRHD